MSFIFSFILFNQSLLFSRFCWEYFEGFVPFFVGVCLCIEMEGGGKRGEEAGPSSGGSSSAGGVGDQRQEKEKDLSEKPSEVLGGVEEEEEEDEEEDHNDDAKDDRLVAGFVPGPLLSLKEQIEKDKVLFFVPKYFSLFLILILSRYDCILMFGIALSRKYCALRCWCT